MNKILSIIIPTYNMEKYLRKCLDSLIVSDENMQLLEVLVINDGSKDSSSLIAHEYEEKYPQTFRVVDKENGNYGSCINRGLREANGKYVKVLDADDFFETTALNDFVVFLQDFDVDLVISDYDVVNANYQTQIEKHFSKIINKSKVEFDFPDYLSNHKKHVYQMHALTYSLVMIRNMNYWQTEGISYTDQEWSTIPMTRVKKAVYFDKALYKYLIGREGQTMLNYLEVSNPQQHFKVVLKLSDFYQVHNYDDSYDNYVEAKLLKLLRSIYDGCLKMGYISDDELREYDNLLKQYPRAYNLAGTLKLYLNFISYVKHWRTNNRLIKKLLVEIPVKLRNSLKR